MSTARLLILTEIFWVNKTDQTSREDVIVIPAIMMTVVRIVCRGMKVILLCDVITFHFPIEEVEAYPNHVELFTITNHVAYPNR